MSSQNKKKRVGLLGCAAVLMQSFIASLYAQGTINFNEPPILYPSVGYPMKTYYEQGFWFQVVNSYQRPPISEMIRWQGSPGGASPYNGTPYIHFGRGGFDDHVLITYTNNALFGLVSVDLADVFAPSLDPISITFEGYRRGLYPDPWISVTFTVGGGGSTTFQTCYFPALFNSNLEWVAITSPRWAMDNLVVPEPSTYALLGLGLLVLAARRFIRRRKL